MIRSPDAGTHDVLVVGAGIAGVTASLELAARGRRVALVEKAAIGGGQSSRNWGFVRKQGCDPAEVDLVDLAAQEWSKLDREIGSSLSLVRKGLVTVAATAERLAAFDAWLRNTNAATRFGSEIVTTDELHELVPSLAGDWAGGLFTPTDGHADPVLAMRALAAAAERAGVELMPGTTAVSLELRGGRVVGVQTTGGCLSAEQVVVAAGAWSSELLRSAGIDLPIRWVRATAARTVAGGPRISELAIGTPNVGFSQAADGSVIFGSAAWSDYDISFESLRHLRLFLPNYFRNRRMFRMHLNRLFVEDLLRRLPGNPLRGNVYAWPRIQDPPPNSAKIKMAHDHLRRIVPVLGTSMIARSWAGIVDVTPDALPVLGPAEDVEGLFMATGLSSHGFGIGPGVGRVVADLVTGQQVPIDVSPYRPGRFRASTHVQAHEHL